MLIRSLILILIFFSCALLGQHKDHFHDHDFHEHEKIYALDLKKELIIEGIAVGLQVGSLLLDQQYDALNLGQIALLDRNNINGFDRGATNNWSDNVAEASDDLRLFAFFVPFPLVAFNNCREEWKSIGVMYLETISLVGGITNITKSSFRRTRPFVYGNQAPEAEKLKLGARKSFLSGHTSITAGLFFMTAKVYADLHPESNLRPFLWGTAITVPALVGYFRYKAGKHFPTDIIAGYGLGAVIGILVPQMHKIQKKKNLRLSPTGNGMSLNLRF